jgi:hypothetical protein
MSEGRGDAAGGVVRAQVEHRRDLPLRLSVTHEAPVAPAPEGQREGVEQDRLPRAGLAGEDAQSLPEVELEPVDEDDVADRELDQHGLSTVYEPHPPEAGTAPDGLK